MKHSAWLLLLASPAVADEIVLHNGARFSGAVSREKGRVHIRTEHGTMSFAAVDVASIRMADDPLLEVERRASTASTPQECHDAARFAAAKGFKTQAQELKRRAVEGDAPRDEGSQRSPAAEIRERLEAEARQRELERLRSAEASRLDAMLSMERDRIDLERARLEQDRKLELRRQRLEALQPPVVVLPAHPHLHGPKRFPWPIWGN